MSPITEKSIAIDGELFADRRGETRAACAERRAAGVQQGLWRHGMRGPQPVPSAGRGWCWGDTMGVPAKFALEISGEDDLRPATVRWRTGEAVGIAFE